MDTAGPFWLDGDWTDEHYEHARALAFEAGLPWWPTLRNRPIYLSASETVEHSQLDSANAYYNAATRQAVVPVSDRRLPHLIAHELGHGLDRDTLDDDDRAKLRDIMGGDDTAPWSWDGDHLHHEHPGEAFAQWVSWLAGHYERESYGPFTFGDVSADIMDVVWAAAKRYEVFPDAPLDGTHGLALHYLAGQGVFEGDADGNANPHEPVTRAQLASVLRERYPDAA